MRGPSGRVILPSLKHANSPNQSARRAAVHLIVLHDTEGAYAGAVNWLCNPQAQASAHIVLREDGCEATQLVPWGRKAWSCVAFNDVSENIEMAGRLDQLGDEQLRTAARITAFRLKHHGLPARWSRDGRSPGFCRHADLGLAGGGHHDPITRLHGVRSWLWFVFLVKREYARGGFLKTWGYE